MNRLLFLPRPPAPVLSARHYGGLALALLVLIVYGSLIPLDFQPLTLGEASARFTALARYPLSDAHARGDWVVSVVQYATLTFLALAALAVDRRPRRGRLAALPVFAAGALLALAIEFTQVWFPPRTVSWNDLIVETTGSLLGVLAWLTAGQRLTDWFRRLWGATGLRALARQALPGYVALLFVVEWMPFDFILRRKELLERLGGSPLDYFPSLADGVLPFAGKAALNAVCFLPLGLLTALALGRLSRRRRWPVAATLGLAVATVIEVGQFFIFSRAADGSDLVTGTAGVLLGWQFGLWCEAWEWDRKWRDAPRRAPRASRLLGAFLVWLCALCVLEWRPGDFTTDPAAFPSDPEELAQYGLRRMSWMPLVDYYWGSKYNALDQFARKTFAFAPLGLLASLLPLRRGASAVLAVGVALLVGVVVEGGQYFLPAHHPSVTDVLLGGLGAGLGLATARHVRAALRNEASERRILA
jgi:VanZ family protein